MTAEERLEALRDHLRDLREWNAKWADEMTSIDGPIAALLAEQIRMQVELIDEALLT